MSRKSSISKLCGQFQPTTPEQPIFKYLQPWMEATPKFLMEQSKSACSSTQWIEQTCSATWFSSVKSRAKHTSHDQITSLETLIKEHIMKNEAIVQSQAVFLRNLKNQIGQLATVMSSRSQGSLPSNTENPRRQVKNTVK